MDLLPREHRRREHDRLRMYVSNGGYCAPVPSGGQLVSAHTTPMFWHQLLFVSSVDRHGRYDGVQMCVALTNLVGTNDELCDNEKMYRLSLVVSGHRVIVRMTANWYAFWKKFNDTPMFAITKQAMPTIMLPNMPYFEKLYTKITPFGMRDLSTYTAMIMHSSHNDGEAQRVLIMYSDALRLAVKTTMPSESISVFDTACALNALVVMSQSLTVYKRDDDRDMPSRPQLGSQWVGDCEDLAGWAIQMLELLHLMVVQVLGIHGKVDVRDISGSDAAEWLCSTVACTQVESERLWRSMCILAHYVPLFMHVDQPDTAHMLCALVPYDKLTVLVGSKAPEFVNSARFVDGRFDDPCERLGEGLTGFHPVCLWDPTLNSCPLIDCTTNLPYGRPWNHDTETQTKVPRRLCRNRMRQCDKSTVAALYGPWAVGIMPPSMSVIAFEAMLAAKKIDRPIATVVACNRPVDVLPPLEIPVARCAFAVTGDPTWMCPQYTSVSIEGPVLHFDNNCVQ